MSSSSSFFSGTNPTPTEYQTAVDLVAQATQQATAALASQTAAATSAQSAQGYSTSASEYATTASNQASAAATSSSGALGYKTAAETAATNSASSASAAATSATNSATSATNASNSASAASTSASAASTSATNASNSAAASASSASDAAASAASAASALTSAALKANNLSDLASASSARSNLGLTSLATTTPGTGVATALTNATNGASGLVVLDGSGKLPALDGSSLTGLLTTVNNSNWSGTQLAIANGGTGATTASGARTNLGLATVAATGAYSDLSGKPTLGSLAALSSINNSNWSGTQLSVANGGTGLTSLTAGYIPFGNGTSAFGSSANLFWDSANSRLGVGTASPIVAVHNASTTATTRTFRVSNSYMPTGFDMLVSSGGDGGYLWVRDNSFMSLGTNNAERLRIDSSGNVGIGTSSPGTKLNVYTGSATNTFIRAQNTLAYCDYGPLSDGTVYGPYCAPAASTSLTIGTVNDNPIRIYTNGTERLRIDSSGNVGIGGTPPAGRSLTIEKQITGAATSFGVQNSGQIQSDVTSNVYMYNSGPSTAAAAFTLGTLTHYRANQSTIGAGSAVTSQVGFIAESSLTGATNNFGFYSNIASGTGRWNFYANGTANNYFAGNVGIGTSSPNGKLDVVCGYTSVFFSSTVNWNFAGLNVTRITSNTASPRLIAMPLDGDSLSSTTIGGYNAIWGVYDSSPTTGSTSSALNGAMVYGAYAGHRWYNNGTERLRIDSSGNVGIGVTNPGTKVSLPNNQYLAWKNAAGTSEDVGIKVDASNVFSVYNSGAVLNYDSNGNLGVGASIFGSSAVRVIAIGNGTAPTTSPAGTGQLYVESGALKYRGSSGTVTTIAAA